MILYAIRHRPTGLLMTFNGTSVRSSSPRLYKSKKLAEARRPKRVYRAGIGMVESNVWEVVPVTLVIGDAAQVNVEESRVAGGLPRSAEG